MEFSKKILGISVAIFFSICLLCIIAMLLGMFDGINFFSKEQGDYTKKSIQQSNIINIKK